MHVLTSTEDEYLSANVATYALPIVLNAAPASLLSLLLHSWPSEDGDGGHITDGQASILRKVSNSCVCLDLQAEVVPD